MQQLKLAAVLLCILSAGGASAQATPAANTGFLPPASSTSNVIDSIAVVVNDEVITRNEVAGRVTAITERMRAQNAPLPAAADLQRQVLEAMIIERAQIQLAKEMGIRIDDAMLDRAISRIAENQNMTVQALRDVMEKEGTPFGEFREEIRKEIMLQRLREYEVDNKIQISDAEIDTYLSAVQVAAADQVELNISHILVRIPENASPEQIAARAARANELMRQLSTGADFAKAAATYSDATDALEGGAIGWRNPNRLPPLFSEALGKLTPGQVTPVMRSTTGFHILKLNETRSAAEAAPEQAIVQQTRVRHILLKVSPTMTAADAKTKLDELRERITAKTATFEELARQFSADGSASKGGDLGWLYPGDVVPEFESAMNKLELGQLSEVVETPYGFHLMEVVERKSDDVTKERERNAARQVIRDRKLAEATEDWARQVRDRAYVEFRDAP
jgi:peptidyl-prolyl cis-trans isomerase SurA